MKEDKYEFTGKHLMVNYMGCDHKALNNYKELEKIMIKACEEAKATVLNTTKNFFNSEMKDMIGISLVLILSESHASIHTYPEYQSCFVDFFTCGSNCLPEKFDETLKKYLKPNQVQSKLFLRDKDYIKKDNAYSYNQKQLCSVENNYLFI